MDLLGEARTILSASVRKYIGTSDLQKSMAQWVRCAERVRLVLMAKRPDAHTLPTPSRHDYVGLCMMAALRNSRQASVAKSAVAKLSSSWLDAPGATKGRERALSGRCRSVLQLTRGAGRAGSFRSASFAECGLPDSTSRTFVPSGILMSRWDRRACSSVRTMRVRRRF